MMDFAKDGKLFTKVVRGRFSEDLSRLYFRQLISAIAHCHFLSISHYDLKSENLLLGVSLSVSDFSLSAIRDDPSLLLLKTMCGTLAYVAPEILAKKGYNSAKANVWSYGVMLFVLISGYPPFNDTNLMAIYWKIYNGLFQFPKWASPDLQWFVSCLLDPNPATRIIVSEILDDSWFYHSGFIPRDRAGVPN